MAALLSESGGIAADVCQTIGIKDAPWPVQAKPLIYYILFRPVLQSIRFRRNCVWSTASAGLNRGDFMTIRNRVMLTSTALTAGLLVAAVTAGADAATVTLNSVSGAWTSTVPVAGVTGEGSNEIRWGTAAEGGSRSGYRFTGVAEGGTYNIDQVFSAATFTHFNQPITGTALESAMLKVDFDVTIANKESRDLVLSSVFNFDHWETPNVAEPCADGGRNNTGVNVNGCADRVAFALNRGSSDSVDINGVLHVLTLTGFVIAGNPATEFWTREFSNNTAEIRGVLTAQSTVVPVPAALPLLLTALASLGVVRYRRRQRA